ncbi:MAG: ParB/RepB/Spo0J family partition protein [Clostridia bacterium]
MAVKKPALGKGLGALIENKEEENTNNIIEVDINKVEPGPGQPRKNFDKEKIDALAASIKEHGIIQPLIVTKNNDLYYIVAGERRWRAARAAGFQTIPVIERSASTKEVMEIALIENIQREDLNPIEEAEAYAKLIQEFSMTQEQVASMVGKSRPAIANTLRLLNFTKKVQKLLISGELTAGQARPILTLEDPAAQDDAAEYIVKTGLNARQAEQYVKKLMTQSQKEKDDADGSENSEQINQQEIRFVQDRLRTSLGTKVLLNDNNGKGKIMIEYYSKEERERLIEFLTKR